MRDVPVEMLDRRREAPEDASSGTVISVKRKGETRAAASPPPPPVWGGMASPRPPTRDFRGPMLFVGGLVAVALVAVALLVYAVSMESRDQFDSYALDGGTPSAMSAENGLAAGTDRGSLWVDGTPYGATLRINTDSVGTVPITLDDLPEGEHLLTLEAGEQALDTLVTVRAGETTAVFLRVEALADWSDSEIDIEPEAPAGEPASPPPSEAVPPPAPATGVLRIRSQPAGALVRLDGVAVGTAPLDLPEVEAGRHAVTVSLAGHDSQETVVEMPPGGDRTVRLSLAATAGPGTLEVLARPWGTIYIDGSLKKRNTDVMYRTQVPAGTHEIRVIHPTFGTQTRQVTVGAGEAVTAVFDLTAGSSDDGS